MNTMKIDNLLHEMVPLKSVCNVNRSYSAIVHKSNVSNADQPKLTASLRINPILIKGGGPNSNPPPEFVISGESHKFHNFTPDLIQQYVNENYPDCRRCFRPGFTSANCNPCKQKTMEMKHKLKQQYKNKNMNSKQIRLELSKVKAPCRCKNCSGGHLYINCNSEAPFCHLDKLNRRAGDRNECEIRRSIGNSLHQAIKMQDLGMNALKMTIRDLLNYILNH